MKKRNFLSPMHKATRQIGLFFEERSAGSGLTPQEGHLLTYLRVYAPAPVGDLVRVFGMKGSTMTGTLDRLEGLGFVERRANPDDRRSFMVVLTARGRTQADATQRFVEETERAIARRVSEKDIDGFFAVMQAVEEVTGVTVRPVRPVANRTSSERGAASSEQEAARHEPQREENDDPSSFEPGMD